MKEIDKVKSFHLMYFYLLS